MIKKLPSFRVLLAGAALASLCLAGLLVEAPYLSETIGTVAFVAAGLAIAGAALAEPATRAFCVGAVAFFLLGSAGGGPLQPLLAWLAPNAPQPKLLTETLVDRLCEWKGAITVGSAVSAYEAPAGSPGLTPLGSSFVPTNLSWQVMDLSGPVVESGRTSYDSYIVTTGDVAYPTLSTFPVYSSGVVKSVKDGQYEIAWADGRTSWIPTANAFRDVHRYRAQANAVVLLLAAGLGGLICRCVFVRAPRASRPAPAIANPFQD